MTQIAQLAGRAVLSLSGADRVGFLNGLVSNDVAEAAPGRAVWAALLTAQGKWLADFFIFSDGTRLLLDCEADQAEMLAQRLGRYRLRADVAIAPCGLRVFAAWGEAPPAFGLMAPDPRLPEAGWRILAEAGPANATFDTPANATLDTPANATFDTPANATFDAWDAHRLSLGLPDGTRDLEAEKTVLLEAGFDELGGISWTKGCYMGQELTARTRYRGLVKRRLVKVRAARPLPPPGTPILVQDREAGQMRSSQGTLGLALLRLDCLEAGELQAGDVALNCEIPFWLNLPQTA